MRVDLNPFYARASENIDLQDKFIKLFSPEILNIFSDYKVWSAVNIFRSSPGGGKTTLLRLFTTSVLKNIKKNAQHDDHNKQILEKLIELEAYDSSNRIQIASTLLSFNNEYATIDYLKISEAQKLNLFFALLNIRIILGVLQGLASIRDMSFPNDLGKIALDLSQIQKLPTAIRGISDGFALYTWAIQEEEVICGELDSISPKGVSINSANTDLYALDVFNPINIKIDDAACNYKMLVMLDDVQNLSASQRKHLLDTIVKKRPLVNTWIAERLRALTMDELYSEGDTSGRDVNIIPIENFWTKKPPAFVKFAKSVADRRLAIAWEDQNSNNFSSFLTSTIEPQKELDTAKALTDVKTRIREQFGRKPRYKQWIESKESAAGNEFEQLIEWRSLEILLNRDALRTLTLFENEELSEERLDEQDDSDVKNAAKLFLNKEYKIPFYFSIDVAAKLASNNIEQFLTIAGALFEAIISNTIKRVVDSNHDLALPPQRQEKIIRKVSSDKWSELQNKIPLFNQVRTLLDAIGQMCSYETYRPNAWNAPGLNGIAITMTERNLIKDVILKDPTHMYYPVANLLSICLSYNLLDFRLNYSCKGKLFMVLYLNRIYCVRYNLPLNNGKFKEQTLKELFAWSINGFTQPKKLH